MFMYRIILLVMFAFCSCKADPKALTVSLAKQYNIDEYFMLALFTRESHWDPKAIGAVGEIGIGQIRCDMHKVKHNISCNRLFDPMYNIRKSFAIFMECYDQFGNEKDAARCYNAGASGARRGRGYTYLNDILKIYIRI